MLFENAQQAVFIPNMPKDRMAGLWVYHHRGDVVSKYEMLLVGSVKQKDPFHFGVGLRKAFEDLKCEPPNTFKAVG